MCALHPSAGLCALSCIIDIYSSRKGVLKLTIRAFTTNKDVC